MGISITRRLALLGGVSGFAFATPLLASPQAKPNIVFILADDLGYADLSCYGRREYKTPHIDRLAAEGMKFTHAYANSAVCSASRVAIMTGRYQDRIPVGLEQPVARPDDGFPSEHPSMPSLFKKTGYNTALVGKWHLGALPQSSPASCGYDRFFGIKEGAADYFAHSQALLDQNELAQKKGYLTEILGDSAVEVIDELGKWPEPYLLSLHFTAPHSPWQGPDDEEESKRIAALGPAGHLDFEGGNQDTYAAMVQSMDEQVGRVLDAIEQTGQAANTIVIFSSDNGGERFSDTWPFKGQKTELLEGGLRIPTLVRWPARIPAGVVSNQVMIHMDWLPTLLAAAGANMDPRYPTDGVNLMACLTSNQAAIPRRLFWRYHYMDQQAVRDGDLKYLKIRENTFLFNVVEDPLERANLKWRQPEDYARLKAQWIEWNESMLPFTSDNYTGGFSGADLADHFGNTEGFSMPKPRSPK